MATYGKVSEYNHDVEDWAEYIEQLKSYFTANDIADDAKKAAILLSSVGATTYKLIKNLTSPEAPSTKTFEEIKSLLDNHYKPKTIEIVARYKFNSCYRSNNETVNDYVAELRNLARDSRTCCTTGWLSITSTSKMTA